MKKILLPILALGGLLFASSCQMDEPDAGTLTGEVDFSITAGIPAGITTYSPDDGKAFSHLGGINNVTGDYVLRFILEVYDGDAVAYEETQYLEDFSNPNVTFNPRLLAKKYDFVFWADFVAKPSAEGSTPTDLYYSTANLSSIEYTQTVKDNPTVLTTDLADAYTANKVIDLSESSQNVNVTLTRPFGKIRLLATDAPQNIENQNSNIPVSATIAFTDATVPATFNARTGEASEPTLSVTGYTFTAVKEPSPVVTGHNDLAQEDKFAYLLGQTYFFESPVSTAYKMTVTVNNATEQIGYRELTNIPVSANKLTTVIGNFYTNEGNIDVIVEDDFGSGEVVIDIWDGSAEEPDIDPGNPNTYLITTPAELAWVAKQVNSKTEYFEGKTILLMNDIDLSGSYWTPVGNVTAYPTVTWDHVISNLTASDDAAVYAAAGLFGSITGTVKNVTLKNVNIRSTHYAGAVVGYSSTNGATIENCHVDGGTITTVPEYTGSAYDNGDKAGGIIGYYVTSDKVTNCSAKNLTITAYRDLGGIVGCGPESGMTECSVENITLVQDNTNGYESEAITTVGALGGRDVTNGNQPYDGEYASAVTKKIVVTSNEQLAAAAIADNAIIYLTKGEYTIPSSAKGKNLTFVGTGDAANTIIECKNDGYDNLNGSTVTFENLTIETDNETYRGFIHVSGATYKNCIIKNQLTLYSDGDPLLFDNCTFNASGNNYNVWTWGTSATFNDCTFDCDGKAMLVYGGGTSEVTFTNCIFNDLGGQNGKAAIETGNDYDATYTININKCTVNGFDVNSVSGSNVWGNKDSMTADKLNVIIDNVDVY